MLLVLISQGISGQSKVSVTDVDFRIENNRMVVEYNIINGASNERYNVALHFITETGRVIIPRSLTGDIGKKKEAGEGKTIVWDMDADRFEFSGNLKAVVSVTPVMYRPPGPSFALLSVAVPGLGGYFMDEKKVRPIVTTVGTAGLLTYGIVEKKKSNKYYNDYKESTDIQNLEELYDKANGAHHRYFIATRIAAVAWMADIVWVAYRGKKNRNETRQESLSSSGTGFTLVRVNNEVQLGYRIAF